MANAYETWGARVRANGGTVTVWPELAAPFDAKTMLATWGVQVPWGTPAARYDVPTYTRLFNAGQINPNLPQAISRSGFAYVVADMGGAVSQASAAYGQYQEGVDPTLPMPDWYMQYVAPILNALGTVEKIAVAGLVGVVGWKVYTAIKR